MDPSACTCSRLHPFELLTAWQKRLSPIVIRMERHGRSVNSDDLDATIALIMRMERLDPACFSEANARHSHHLPGCPWHPKARAPRPSPEEALALRTRVAMYRAEGAQAWAAQYAEAVNRWFSGGTAGSDEAAG